MIIVLFELGATVSMLKQIPHVSGNQQY